MLWVGWREEQKERKRKREERREELRKGGPEDQADFIYFPPNIRFVPGLPHTLA